MNIIQGSNMPVLITFDSNVTDILDIHVAIFDGNHETVKHWGINDVEIDENTVVCPLTQEETLGFRSGNCFIEVKWMETDGYVYMADTAPVTILTRYDKHVIGGE